MSARPRRVKRSHCDLDYLRTLNRPSGFAAPAHGSTARLYNSIRVRIGYHCDASALASSAELATHHRVGETGSATKDAPEPGSQPSERSRWCPVREVRPYSSPDPQFGNPRPRKSPPRSSTTTVDPPRPRTPADVRPRSTQPLTSQRASGARNPSPRTRRPTSSTSRTGCRGRMTRRTTTRPTTGAHPFATRKPRRRPRAGETTAARGTKRPARPPAPRTRRSRLRRISPRRPPPARPSRTSSARTIP